MLRCKVYFNIHDGKKISELSLIYNKIILEKFLSIIL